MNPYSALLITFRKHLSDCGFVVPVQHFNLENIQFEPPKDADGNLLSWVGEQLINTFNSQVSNGLEQYFGSVRYALYWPKGCGTREIADAAWSLQRMFCVSCLKSFCDDDNDDCSPALEFHIRERSAGTVDELNPAYSRIFVFINWSFIAPCGACWSYTAP